MFLRHRFEQAAQHIIQKQPEPPRRFAGAIIGYALFDIFSISFWLFGGLAIFLALRMFYHPNISSIGQIQATFGYLGGMFISIIPIVLAWGDLHALRFGQRGTARIIRITQQTSAYTDKFITMVQGRYQVLCGHRLFERDFTLVRRWGKDLREGMVLTVLVDPEKPLVLLELDPALDR